jgi:hypothetical protein
MTEKKRIVICDIATVIINIRELPDKAVICHSSDLTTEVHRLLEASAPRPIKTRECADLPACSFRVERE